MLALFSEVVSFVFVFRLLLLFLRLYCFAFLFFLVRLLLFPFVRLFVLVVAWDLRLEHKNEKHHHVNDPNAVLYK
jgi:hypothetical protein